MRRNIRMSNWTRWTTCWTWLLGSILFAVTDLVSSHIPVPQPEFRSVPISIKMYENETVHLPCQVDNLGENVLRWWKADVLLADSSDPALISPPKMTMLRNHTLQVEGLQPEDAGQYTCQIVRAEPWSPIEQVHQLQVMYAPRVFTVPATGYLEVDLGEEVEMGCMATGVPTPVVTWRTKGETMVLIDNRHRLKFVADNRLMSGVYQCEATNGVGDPIIQNIQLRILYKPEITVDRTWVHTAPGVRSEIICRISADPEAQVEWLFEGAPLELASSRIVSHVHGDGHILLFRNVRATDFGEYTCQAKNLVGEAQVQVQLSGVANAAVFKKDIGKPFEDSYTLIWEVDSYSAIIEYNLLFREQPESPKTEAGTDWIKLIIPADGHAPGPIHSKSYTLTGLKAATVYQAMCLSRNRYGWSGPSTIFRFATQGGNFTEEDNNIEAETEKSMHQKSIPEISSVWSRVAPNSSTNPGSDRSFTVLATVAATVSVSYFFRSSP